MKGGVSVLLSTSRSAIFWKLVLSQSLQHATHLWITLVQLGLHWLSKCHYSFNWFRVSPLAPCVTLLWLHWIIMSETSLFLGRMTGWSASVKLDFLNLPPTRMILSLSRKGSSWLMLLLLGTIFLSEIRCLTSLLKNSASFQHQWFDLAVAIVKLYQSFLAICLLSPISIPWLFSFWSN